MPKLKLKKRLRRAYQAIAGRPPEVPMTVVAMPEPESTTQVMPPAEPAMEQAIQKGRLAVQRILDAPASDLNDRRFLLDCFRQFGIPYCDWYQLSRFVDYVNPVAFGIQQTPTEFVDYLMLVGRETPKTVIEIGVLHGGVAVFSAAYLLRKNPALEYTCVDICDQFHDFDHYQARLPIRKVMPATSADFHGQSFDLAFIDADHAYDGVKKDWLHVGRYADIAAFHDVRGTEHDHLNGGIRRFWLELKASISTERSMMEIAHYPIEDGSWMGIGIVFNRSLA